MNGTPANLGYRMPAEWEKHEATWISWPKNPETFPPEVLPQVEETYVQIVNSLTPEEEVWILVDDERMERRVKSLLPKTEQVVFHHIRTVDVWVRDYGPTYVKGKGVALVKWRFNAWGSKYQDLLPDGESGERIAKSSGSPVFKPGMVLEGGSIEVDGKGTVMTTEQCLLNPNRNPQMKKEEIEELLRGTLSTKKVLWLGSGIEGDDTDGHIDDFARFVAPGKVVVATEQRRADPNHAPLRAARKALESVEDSRGRSIEMTAIPMPPPQSSPDGRLPASHLNFYIGNGAILLPTFGGESDKQAVGALEGAFPHRQIVPIDCRALVFGLGAIHCVTQQVPKVG
ncbi:MAG TPA: agmatine deiminase family protein [Nitrososphaerales archaeon]|nr:agmatine deiminase family protein [Nitrososphaerales archaeon]